ncbi:MAG: hypothetical protein ACYC1E_15865 [Propionibacteriaceae bacterium]
MTAVAGLLATGLVTHFFSPDELSRTQHQFWSLPVVARLALVGGTLVLPSLILAFGHLVWNTTKGLIGWEYPADRSPRFIASRSVALVVVGGAIWMLTRLVLDLGLYLIH